MAVHMAMLGDVHYLARKLVQYRRHDANMGATVSKSVQSQELVAVAQKWWAADGFTASQREKLRSAILFEHWLFVLMHVDGAWAALRRGDAPAACRLILRAGNRWRRFLVDSVRRVLPR